MKKNLTYSSISNIQNFLNCFKKSTDYSLFSLEFIANNRVFASDCQLPDMWLKTRTPIDRNEMYYQGKKKMLSLRNNGNHSKSHSKLITPLYFPCIPLIIPNDSQLKCSGLRVQTLSMDSLFDGTDMVEVPDKNPPTSTLLKKEEVLMNDILEKTWFISFFHEGKFINYGPMNTYKVYMFLQNMYGLLPQAEKEKKNFMVVDFVCDVHFQPDMLLEILSEEFDKVKTIPIAGVAPMKVQPRFSNASKENSSTWANNWRKKTTQNIKTSQHIFKSSKFSAENSKKRQKFEKAGNN